jgi:hypothetical protein
LLGAPPHVIGWDTAERLRSNAVLRAGLADIEVLLVVTQGALLVLGRL